MALDYNAAYPGLMRVDAVNYPQGKPRNTVVEGDAAGTPWEKQLAQDYFGFLQACMVKGGVSESAVPDTAVASDYLDGLRQTLRDRSALLDWRKSSGLGTSPDGGFKAPGGTNFFPVGAFHDAYSDTWIVCGTLGGTVISRNGGEFFHNFHAGHTSTNILLNVAGAGTAGNRSIVMIDQFESAVWRMDDFTTGVDPVFGEWVQSASLPGAYRLRGVVFDGAYFVVGIATTGGNTDGYFAVSDDVLGTTYTQMTRPTSFAGVTAHAIVLGNTGNTVVVAEGAHTKVAWRDGPGDFADSTTLPSKIWRCTWSEFFQKFYLIESNFEGAAATRELYSSSDGDVWTFVSNVDPSAGTASISSDFDSNLIAAYGGVLVVKGLEIFTGGFLSTIACFSFDGGLTWDQIPVGGGIAGNGGVVSDTSQTRLLMMTRNTGAAYVGRIR